MGSKNSKKVRKELVLTRVGIDVSGIKAIRQSINVPNVSRVWMTSRGHTSDLWEELPIYNDDNGSFAAFTLSSRTKGAGNKVRGKSVIVIVEQRGMLCIYDVILTSDGGGQLRCLGELKSMHTGSDADTVLMRVMNQEPLTGLHKGTRSGRGAGRSSACRVAIY